MGRTTHNQMKLVVRDSMIARSHIQIRGFWAKEDRSRYAVFGCAKGSDLEARKVLVPFARSRHT